MTARTREALAQLLIREAENKGGPFGVLVLMEECRKKLEELPPDVKSSIGYPAKSSKEEVWY